jgi:hypothetical protein
LAASDRPEQLTDAKRKGCFLKCPTKILILGANSAIAIAVARLYCHQHASFFLVGRDAEKLERVKNDLKVRGARHVTAVTADLKKTDVHTELVRRAQADLGEIDLALIAHGFMPDQKTAEMDFESAKLNFEINFLSPVSLLTSLANAMEEKKAGTIAVITSVAADRGRKSNYVYGSAKAGLSTFLEGLRYRLVSSNVNILEIKPGFTDTPMTANLKKGILFSSPETVAKVICKAVSKRRSVVYAPGFWRLIMLVIKMIPAKIFAKMNI